MKNRKVNTAGEKISLPTPETVTATGITLKFNKEKTDLDQSAGKNFIVYDIIYDHRKAQ